MANIDRRQDNLPNLLAFEQIFYELIDAFRASRNDFHVCFALRVCHRRFQHVDRQIDACQGVANFARQVGQAGEARLLVLAALVLADELAEANETLRGLGAQVPAPDGTAVAAGVDRLAARVEAVATRLETSHI